MSTTIKLEDDVKEALDAENLEHESFSDTVKRLLGEDTGIESVVQDIVAEQTPDEDRIRSMARAEAKDMIRQYQ